VDKNVDKLSETHDFISLYLHHIGQSEVPRQFHLWACLSLLAASVSDRIWVQVDVVRRLYPNLYVFLIGPSGSGKEVAIRRAVALANSKDNGIINTISGGTTRQALMDRIGKKVGKGTDESVIVNSKFYFVTEELGSSIPPGDLGYALISFMTEIYTRTDQPIQYGTRSHGIVEITQACPNWLAGTTDEWLRLSIPKYAIEGGFLARVFPITGQRDYSKRYPKILYPGDYSQVSDHLAQRVRDYTWLTGGFALTEEASAFQFEWYHKQPEEVDPKLIPSFNRADEMVHRLSLLLKLSEMAREKPQEVEWHPEERYIEARHFKEAVRMWDGVLHHDIPGVHAKASATMETTDVDVAARFIKRFRVIDLTKLLQRVHYSGMHRVRLEQALITLYKREDIKMDHVKGESGRYRWVYTWIGGANGTQ